MAWCQTYTKASVTITTAPGGWFNIKMTSYQYRKSHCGDKKILRPSYLHNGISLYWIRAQVSVQPTPINDNNINKNSDIDDKGNDDDDYDDNNNKNFVTHYAC